ncbi:DUF3649 domain-containing protein [Sphingobium sp.]
MKIQCRRRRRQRSREAWRACRGLMIPACPR